MNTENDAIFSKLETSYTARCRDSKGASAVWQSIIKQFPPDRPERFDTRPSLRLSRESGDMGLALIWTVQAALTHPLLKILRDQEQNSDTLSLLKKISRNKIGALAISEDKNRPLIVQNSGGALTLSGEKKYITGGSFSDFILLTGRYPKEKKLSCMFLLPVQDIPGNAFEELDVGCFYTTHHARLTMNDYQAPKATLLSTEPSIIRKSLRMWGIIERSIIMESVAGLALYLAEQMRRKTGYTILNIIEMEAGLHQISKEIDQQIGAARKGHYVNPLSPVSIHLLDAMQHLRSFYDAEKRSLTDESLYRFKDMFYFSSRLTEATIA